MQEGTSARWPEHLRLVTHAFACRENYHAWHTHHRSGRSVGTRSRLTSYTAGGLIHILLVIAIIVVLIRVIQGRNPLKG